MKIPILSVIIGLLLITQGVTMEAAESDGDPGYTALNEAYQARREGNQELAREKLSVALDIFRNSAADKGPGLVRPETEYGIEETPKDITLIENKTLFKIEFRIAPSSPGPDSRDTDDSISRQQMILQKLILLSRENEELKKSLSRVEANTRETGNIGDMISDIRDDTSNISELNDRIDDIRVDTSDIAELSDRIDDVRDNTDDINDSIDKLDDGNDSADKVEDIADDLSDLRDDIDILKDILNIVEDIKNDTEDIKDLEDSIDEVKDAVQNIEGQQ